MMKHMVTNIGLILWLEEELGDGFCFSAKTLGKSLFHLQNDWSGHGPAGQF